MLWQVRTLQKDSDVGGVTPLSASSFLYTAESCKRHNIVTFDDACSPLQWRLSREAMESRQTTHSSSKHSRGVVTNPYIIYSFKAINTRIIFETECFAPSICGFATDRDPQSRSWVPRLLPMNLRLIIVIFCRGAQQTRFTCINFVRFVQG